MFIRPVTFLIIFCAFFMASLRGESPSALYLTWKEDPTTTMVIHWHSSERSKESTLFYRKEGSDKWLKQEGASVCAKNKLLIHSVELTGLDPDTFYQFSFGAGGSPYRFRTCADPRVRPLRFAVGGDVYFYLYLLRKMNSEIAKKDPDFVIVGGDVAYAHGHKSPFKGKDWEIKRWGTFFKEWKKQMVAPDGRLIPMLLVIGNHDVKNPVKHPRAGRPLFYDFAALPHADDCFRVIDFGSTFSLFLLDTGHLAPIDGKQREWLEEVLKKRAKVPHKMATYHVAAYPSVYSFQGRIPTLIRESWVPLFEQYGVKAAFENHNHAYKRTHPLKAGKIDPSGVLYLGDGAWGVSPRKPIAASKEWYLAKTAKTNCFWLVTIGEKCSIESYDNAGKLLEKVQ